VLPDWHAEHPTTSVKPGLRATAVSGKMLLMVAAAWAAGLAIKPAAIAAANWTAERRSITPSEFGTVR